MAKSKKDLVLGRGEKMKTEDMKKVSEAMIKLSSVSELLGYEIISIDCTQGIIKLTLIPYRMND